MTKVTYILSKTIQLSSCVLLQLLQTLRKSPVPLEWRWSWRRTLKRNTPLFEEKGLCLLCLCAVQGKLGRVHSNWANHDDGGLSVQFIRGEDIFPCDMLCPHSPSVTSSTTRKSLVLLWASASRLPCVDVHLPSVYSWFGHHRPPIYNMITSSN